MAIKFEGSPHPGEAPAGRGWLSRLRGDAPEAPQERGAETHAPRPRRSSVRGWLRDLISPEPAEERRRRIEAEAAAELGLNGEHQPENAG